MIGRASLLLIVALGFTGCRGDDEPSEIARVSIGDIEVEPPDGWVARDLGPGIREWSPSKNPGRETVTLIVGPPFLGGDAERIFATTRTAQGLLRDVERLGSGPVTSASGLAGMQFDLRFRPDSAGGTRFQRSHVVLITGEHPVHLLYTAVDPDPRRAVLARMVSTIQQAGG